MVNDIRYKQLYNKKFSIIYEPQLTLFKDHYEGIQMISFSTNPSNLTSDVLLDFEGTITRIYLAKWTNREVPKTPEQLAKEARDAEIINDEDYEKHLKGEDTPYESSVEPEMILTDLFE